MCFVYPQPPNVSQACGGLAPSPNSQPPSLLPLTKTRVGVGNGCTSGNPEEQGRRKCAKPEPVSSLSFLPPPGSTHILTPQKLLDTLKKLNKTDEEISS